ncbi:MAG: anion transporter, partial [Rhodospirillales bacterium]|nr:anion transporter [Rhodospirillales bacterium]
IGAILMVVAGGLGLDAAYRTIDYRTLGLLFGMMVLVAHLSLSGVFAVMARWVVLRVSRPVGLLAVIVVAAGVLSALFVNDTICLVFTPVVLDLAEARGLSPLPLLIGLATGANIGSVATITGNPQNMLIGGFSAIPYANFAGALAPVAVAGLVVAVVLIVLLHRREFAARGFTPVPLPRPRANRVLVGRALAAVGVVLALFFAGQPPAKAAIVVGAALLLTRRVKSWRVYAEVDWSLLLMFAGLFVIVAGAERQLLSPAAIAAVGALRLGRVWLLSAITAVLSNLVSNVPAVLVLKPFVAALAQPRRAWLVVAMASTLAGNLTLLGSIANLIVAEKAQRRGVTISFRAYLTVGVPVTLATIAIGALWLGWMG